MTGGRQLESRRSKLRSILGENVTLVVRNSSQQSMVEGALEFRSPDEGYFLKGTSAQVIVSCVKNVLPNHNYIFMDLPKSFPQISRNYLEAKT